MGKVCYINGFPYLVSLPKGGKNPNDLDNPWDRLIGFLWDDCDDIFHWNKMFSWCQETVGMLGRSRVIRGYRSARCWIYDSASLRNADLGFRPVLVPLDPATMKPDPSLLDDIIDGSRIALTSLYMGGRIVAEPQNPTWDGDIVDYVLNAEITLGNKDRDPKNWLHVIKYKDLLWMDRNILKSISWEELKAQGYAEGGT